MNGQQSSLGQLMNPMQPQGRVPSLPQQSMVAPNDPQRPGMPPQMPPPAPPQAMPPPQGGATPPVGTGQSPGMMPQQMPDIVQLLMQRLAMQGQQPNGMPMNPGMGGTQVQPGLQSAPVRGAPPSVGGR